MAWSGEIPLGGDPDAGEPDPGRSGADLPAWAGSALRRELHRSRARTTALLQTAPVAILGLDSARRITVANEAALELLDRDGADLLGFPLVELFSGSFVDQLRRLLDSGGERRVLTRGSEWRLMRPSGETIPVELTLARAPIDDEVGYTAFLRDITDRVADRERVSTLVRELREQTRRAERANRSKTDFLSRVSHELRTPLNAILGFTELIQLETAEPTTADSVEQILTAGRQLLALVEDLLDIGRIEAGQLRLDVGPVRVREVLVESVELVGGHAARTGVRLDLAEGEDLVARADRRRLVQVVTNLLTNAVKYGGPGGSVTVAASSGPSGVTVTVADEGPGMTGEDLGRAFEPFDRLGAEGTDVAGTGLGLAVCRQLTEAMGGAIELRSEAGRGTTAVVTLGRAD